MIHAIKMKDLRNPRIETDLRKAGRQSWNIQRRERKFVDAEREETKAFLESLELLLSCPDDLIEINLPNQAEHAEVVLFPPSPEKADSVPYILARLSGNQGYLALNKKHFFYAPTLEGVYEFLERINECPENPNKQNLKYCSVISP